MAKKKKEEEEKKTKQKRTRRKVDYIYTGHSRDRDRNAIKHAHEAQFVANKENFVQRRTMIKKSELAKNFDSGRLTSKDLGEVNKIVAESAKNKATMITNATKAAKKTQKRPKIMVKAGRAVKKYLDKQIKDKKDKQNKGVVTGVGRDPKESDKDKGNAKPKPKRVGPASDPDARGKPSNVSSGAFGKGIVKRKRPVKKKKTKNKLTISVKPIKVETKKEEEARKKRNPRKGNLPRNRYGVKL